VWVGRVACGHTDEWHALFLARFAACQTLFYTNLRACARTGEGAQRSYAAPLRSALAYAPACVWAAVHPKCVATPPTPVYKNSVAATWRAMFESSARRRLVP
jgi:hypothetical protein